MRTRLRLLANVSHWGFLVGQNSTHEITKLLQGWQGRDRAALDALLPAVYEELRRLAHCELRHERPDHTLQSAALVNEAYLRQILVDYARRRRAGKRGAGQVAVPLEDASQLSSGKGIDVVVLDDALKALAELDPWKAKV